MSLHLELILGTETAYSNQEKNNKTAIPGKRGESGFHSYHIIRFKLFNKKITKHTKKQQIVAHSKEKVNQQKLSLMAYLPDKDSKTTILKVFKELKEDMQDIKKTMHE